MPLPDTVPRNGSILLRDTMSSKVGAWSRSRTPERLDGRDKRLHDLTWPTADLPNGAMILQRGAPHLILQGQAHLWSPGGYGAPAAVLDSCRLITPPSTVAALKAGYRPLIHGSAFG